MKSYIDEAISDTKNTANYFFDEIVEKYIDDGEVDTSINDYSNSYHHENHVDRAYYLSDAVKVLEDLDEYEVNDEGLWEGLSPKEAISAIAAYTYGNAVASMFTTLMGNINDDDNLVNLKAEYDEIEDAVDKELEEEEEAFEAEHDEAEAVHDEMQEELPEDEQVAYDRPFFNSSFDRDLEIENRQKTLRGKIEDNIKKIIKSFN